MACDGDIAKEEVDIVRDLSANSHLFDEVDIEKNLKEWIAEINENGAGFLKKYLDELSGYELTTDDQLQIIDLALATIEADERIEYSEIKFFKKIRSRLSVSDDEILSRHPDKEDFLLPDIKASEDLIWSDVKFADISIASLKI